MTVLARVAALPKAMRWVVVGAGGVAGAIVALPVSAAVSAGAVALVTIPPLWVTNTAVEILCGQRTIGSLMPPGLGPWVLGGAVLVATVVLEVHRRKSEERKD